MSITPEQRDAAVAAEPLRAAGRAAGSGFAAPVKELWRRRDLVLLLTQREIRARYKDSSLGIVWSLLRPLAQLLVYYFAIGELLGVARQIPQFAIFVFVGLSAWTFYAEVVQKATQSIVQNAGLVKKIYLPREVFPLASLGAGLFTFAVQFVILIAAILVLGEIPSLSAIPYAIAGFVVVALFALAVGLLLAGINVYLRDVEHLVEVAFVVLFWASPIVYSFGFVTEKFGGTWLETAYLANPITVGILGMQRGLWAAGADPAVGGWPNNLPLLLAIAIGFGLALLAAGHALFNRLQGNFAQEV
jgi:ABC-2 type transport system permease protein